MQSSKNSVILSVLGAFGVVLLGVFSAWVISSRVGMRADGVGQTQVAGRKAGTNEAGVLDPKIKYDTTSGLLVEGGIGNEGTHHLERDGGPSKNVYLTSTVVDLGSFVGKKVEVWGQTLGSKKAGWLMDVAKIKLAD